MAKTYNGFSRENAKEFCCKAIDEIYDHNPTKFNLFLRASVDGIPEYRISYDGYAKICAYQREETREDEHNRKAET